MKPIQWLLVVPFLLAGCGDGDGRVPIVVYSPHGPDILKEFEQAFEAIHPEVDVQTQGLPTIDILTRIRGEAENPRCDVWWGAPSSSFLRAADEGLLDAYRPSWSDSVDPRFLDEQQRFAGHFVIPQVILYNRDRMDAASAPTDWDDLLTPTWKDRIILRFPMPSGSMRGAFSWLVAWKAGPGGDPSDPTAGYAFLEALHANTKKYAINPNEFFEAIKRDPDNAVGIWNLTDALFQRDQKGYPFGVSLPESGCPVVVDCIALVKKKGDQPERAVLAREFYEFVTNLESGKILMDRHARILTRSDVPEQDLPAWQKEYAFRALPVDPATPARHEDEWMTHWDTQIKTIER